MKKLAMIILTFNRAKHIKEDLEAVAEQTKEHDIDIYVYDGSTNMHTEYIVKYYIKMGYSHIHYIHMINDKSPREGFSQRLNDALQNSNAEYVCVCGDRFVLKPEFYSKIESYIIKSYDIITIYSGILQGTKEFNKADKFADYTIVPITQIGSTIIKKSLISQFDMTEIRKFNPSFGFQSTYLLSIANIKEFKGVVIDGEKKVNVPSKFDTKSGSQSYMWDAWISEWYHFISSLPDTYDNIREGLFNKPDQQAGFFSAKELLRQRSQGQFDWKKYLAYRKYVKKVIVMPGAFVFGISLLPQNVAKFFYSVR